MRDLIRASSLQGFDGLVTELGGDPIALRHRVGLDPDVGRDPDAYLAYSTLADLLGVTAEVLGCRDFGLRLARTQGIDILGAVALIARHSSTASEAMAGLRQYGRFYSPAFEVDLRRLDDRRSRYTFTITVPRIPHPEQVLELSLGVSLDLFRILLGKDFRPRRTHLPHTAIADPSVYREFFGSPVDFRAAVCGLDIDRDDLERPRATDDPQVRRLAERYLESATGADDLDIQVRELIRRCLPTGKTTVAAVAEHLDLHPRTLQRRLREDGTTFETMLDEVRRDRARVYLLHTDRTLGQIASMVGYSEQSTLTRAARRWFGEAPQHYRARHGARTG